MRKIEDYPDTFKSIQAFYQWSVGCYSPGDPNPFNAYLDFIGYDSDGESSAEYRFSGSLSGDLFGFHEYCLLADALKVFENHGYEDVYSYISLLHLNEL